MHPFPTPWKQKTVWFSDVFRGWRKGALGTNGLISILNKCFPSPLLLPAACILESFIEIKINWNFDFHTSLWCLKRFYEGLSDTTFLTRFTFQIETSHFICTANQMTGFYLKYSTGLKWVHTSVPSLNITKKSEFRPNFLPEKIRRVCWMFRWNCT